MIVIKSIRRMQSISDSARKSNRIIGFVPTMGYFHDGHLSLMKIARPKCDLLVVSIFVNPIQFGVNEDFSKYPRDIKRDKKLCESVNVDIVFIPNECEIYPPDFSTKVEVAGRVTECLCGAFRPGHFSGVATIVAKFFNIIKPHFSVFGQKDAQQLVVIKKMVKELNFPVEIVAGATVREQDGLAMSSRNEYLTPEHRHVAPVLYKSLLRAKNLLISGHKDASVIISEIRKFIDSNGPFRIQYIEILNADTLESIAFARGKIMIALAAFLGKTRLIDNIVVEL